MDALLERKRDVLKLLRAVEKYPASSVFKHEMMTFSYVLVCGAIEYMVEIILQDWLDRTLKHHRSISYRGKKYVQHFLDIQFHARNNDIGGFHSTKLSKIKEIICSVAGNEAKDNFSQMLVSSNQSASVQVNAIDSRLGRINRTRHELAHGQKMPGDIQPNITELKKDFIFVYEKIIKNIQKSLPKVPKIKDIES